MTATVAATPVPALTAVSHVFVQTTEFEELLLQDLTERDSSWDGDLFAACRSDNPTRQSHVATALSGNVRISRTDSGRTPVWDRARTMALRIVAPRRSAATAVTTGCECGVIAEDQAGPVYNEEAFHYFLGIEQKRVERSPRPCFLLLVHSKDYPSSSARLLPAPIAETVFEVLRLSLRETDFTGWYAHLYVAGAVLTHPASEMTTDVPTLVTHRVTRALDRALPAGIANLLQVQVVSVPILGVGQN
jgi:hypothetical protein